MGKITNSCKHCFTYRKPNFRNLQVCCAKVPVIDCSSNISIPIMLKKLIYFLKIESNKYEQHNELLSFTMAKISKRL